MNLDKKIILKNIYKNFVFNNEKVEVLKNINLEINSGEFLVIMGPSGVGKSTLLNILGLLDKASDGEFIWKGSDVSNLDGNSLAEIRSQEIGFVFQQYNLINTLNVRENVLLPLYLNKYLSNDEKNKKVETVLKQVGITNRSNNFPSTLSGGEQQRVAIARSLVNNPSIIIADEPTGNVDQDNEESIINILRGLVNEGKSVLVVTHNDIYKKFASRIFYIKNGSLVEGGTRNER